MSNIFWLIASTAVAAFMAVTMIIVTAIKAATAVLAINQNKIGRAHV